MHTVIRYSIEHPVAVAVVTARVTLIKVLITHLASCTRTACAHTLTARALVSGRTVKPVIAGVGIIGILAYTFYTRIIISADISIITVQDSITAGPELGLITPDVHPC
jgi:hypothetical protein